MTSFPFNFFQICERDALGILVDDKVRIYPDVLDAADRTVFFDTLAINTACAPAPIGKVVLPKLEDDDASGAVPPAASPSTPQRTPGAMPFPAVATVRPLARDLSDTSPSGADTGADDDDDDDDGDDDMEEGDDTDDELDADDDFYDADDGAFGGSPPDGSEFATGDADAS